jgi:hypothetical protein
MIPAEPAQAEECVQCAALVFVAAVRLESVPGAWWAEAFFVCAAAADSIVVRMEKQKK